MINKILVIGGTGMLGRPVLQRLIDDGYQVRLMTHTPDRARLFFGDAVETAVGDVTDIKSLSSAMDGCDAVYINLNAKMDSRKYKTIEEQGTQNIADVAAEKNVKRIAMISGLNAKESDSNYQFIASKLIAENALIKSGIPYTILRCCWFYESLPLFIKGKRAIILGKQPLPVSWLAATDYAAMVSRSFRLNEAANRIFLIRGIEKIPVQQALEIFIEQVVPDVTITHLPLWLASLAGMLSRKSQIKGFVQFMRYFETHSEPPEDGEAEKMLGPALTTLHDWAEEYKKRLLAAK